MTPVAPPASLGTALMPQITIDGAPLPTRFLDELVEMRVQTAVRTIGRCTLRFRDPEYELAESKYVKVGALYKVAGREIGDGAQTTMFTGKVTSVAFEQRTGQSVDLVVVVEDGAYKLSRNSRAATYLKQTYGDVVSSIVDRAGMAKDVRATTGKNEYLLQSDTDLQFIDEIARRIGWEWLVDHEGKFHFWQSWGSSSRDVTLGPQVTLTAGEDLQSFSVKVWSDGAVTANVRGWDHLEKSAVAAEVKGVPGVPRGLKETLALGGADPAVVLDARSNPTNQAEAKQIATWRSRGAGSVSVRGRAWSVPEMRPGVLVELKGVGPATGKYFVHEVRHLFNREGLVTEFVAGDRESFGLGTGPDVTTTSSFGHQGLVIAVVSNVKDPESLGRVKVKFDGLDNAIESDWGRVATDSAGADRGAVFIPSVGDQVLVGFEGGDARRPVVLGGLYSKKDQIPPGTVVDGVVENQRITSRSGHVIELSDGKEDAKNHVLLRHATKQHSLRIGKDAATLEVPSGVPVTLKAGDASITMDKNGGVTIQGTKITFKAQQDVAIEGTNISVKGRGKAEVSAGTLDLKAQGQAELSASGVVVVKGGMVQIN